MIFQNNWPYITLDTKIWTNILSSYESKKNIQFWIYRQLKYYQLWIRSEVGILVEIILNAFKCLTASGSTEIFILAIVPLLLISISILCELATLSDVYIVLSLQKEEVYFSSWGDRCTHLESHSSKRLNTLSIIILVCLGNTSKARLQDKLLLPWSS